MHPIIFLVTTELQYDALISPAFCHLVKSDLGVVFRPVTEAR